MHLSRITGIVNYCYLLCVALLLKNNKNILPLTINHYKKIAVVGPCAVVNYLGDYSGIPSKNVSILEGIRNKVKNTEIIYHKGVDLTTNGDTISMNNYQYINTAIFPAIGSNRNKIKEAVAAVGDAEIIICAVGENEHLSREVGEGRMVNKKYTALGLPSYWLLFPFIKPIFFFY